jgi:hypothetical protein
LATRGYTPEVCQYADKIIYDLTGTMPRNTKPHTERAGLASTPGGVSGHNEDGRKTPPDPITDFMMRL